MNKAGLLKADDCAKNLINLNIKKIYFSKYYDGINMNNEDLKKYLNFFKNHIEFVVN